MPVAFCRCQCKMCRVPGTMHCRAHPSCGAPPLPQELPPPPSASAAGATRIDARRVTRALVQLRADCGSHSPSVAQIERAIPGLVQIDACFLSNPYATDEVLTRLRAIPPAQLEQMVAHYPSQAPAIAAILAPHLGVPAQCLHLANGACEVIQALLAATPGPVLLSLPTFSAYYEFAHGPVIAHHLDPHQNFRLDLDTLEAMIARHAPRTVVIINPNNPDGGLIPHAALIDFLHHVHDRVDQIIIDESFSHFTTEAAPETLCGLVPEMPHLVVVNSLSKSHGIAGLRLGYAVMSAQRARELRNSSLWNLNAFAQWFCTLLGDPDYQHAYDRARRRYIHDTRRLFTELDTLPNARAYRSAANFSLLQLERPAAEVAGSLLAHHGVYVRDCADKRGLDDGERYIRVAARTNPENHRILDALRTVLSQPAHGRHTPSSAPVHLIHRSPASSTPSPARCVAAADTAEGHLSAASDT
jgi:histidinol-phosphate/aromatic aminotransferase/cobyric acid decarboxylase-like protein